MGDPTTWSAPSSGATIGTAGDAYVSYGGGYWFTLMGGYGLRYATDPTGAWGTATLPAPPTGFDVAKIVYDESGVAYGNGVWAFIVEFLGPASALKYRIIHTSDPTGAWSSHEYDATDMYRCYAMTYGDSTWAIAGRDMNGVARSAVIGSCSTVDGTYTINTSTATTGYDATSVGYRIRDIAWDGTNWVTVADTTASGNDVARTSTALTSGWAAPSSFPSTGEASALAQHGNGYWTVVDNFDQILYTDTPSGTWSALTATDLGLDNTTYGIAYGGGYWVAVGDDKPATYRVAATSYLGAAPPSGTYAAVADPGMPTGSFNIGITSVAHAGGYFVAASDYDGDIRWAYARTPRPFPRPRGLPGNPRLRQRQTPIITK